MTDDKRILWLVSYPKSGNTWVRILLNGLLSGDSAVGTTDLNALDVTDHAAARWLVETVSACPTSELTESEIDRLRAVAYGAVIDRRSGPVFMKVHDAYRMLDNEQEIFPQRLSKLAIYLIRNPLDVAVSFAAHLGVAIDQAIEFMAQDFYLAHEKGGALAQVPQCLGSWSRHVASWQAQPAIRVLTVRYEDLSSDTAQQLRRIAVAAGLPAEDAAIGRAVEAAKFDRLQKLERTSGFREKPPTQNGLFFRSGRAGGWREVLEGHQVDQLVASHHATMARFGYLDDL